MLRVLRIAEFRALWAAEALSQIGDQLARVALAVLVYTQTQSTLLTGVTYALTFVPTLAGTAVWGGLADRFDRRTVLIGFDVLRAVLVAAIALPGLPLWIVLVLITVMIGAGGPFRGAQQALLPEVLPADDDYTAGLALRSVTIQTSQLLGFGLGGVVVSIVSPRGALLIDAATFLGSAVVVACGVRRRRIAEANDELSTLARARRGIRVVIHDGGLRTLMALTAILGIYIAPEALAVPYAATLSSAPWVVGAVMAADPLGSIVGAWLATYWPRQGQLGALGGMAAAAGVPLGLICLHPPVWLALLLVGVCGLVGSWYLVPTSVAIGRAAPAGQRAQVLGLYTALLIAAQGVGSLVWGAAAEWIDPATTIGIAGGVGIVIALLCARRWRQAVSASPDRYRASIA